MRHLDQNVNFRALIMRHPRLVIIFSGALIRSDTVHAQTRGKQDRGRVHCRSVKTGCGYGTLMDELIHDHIEEGIKNGEVSEKLQIKERLTLNDA